MQKPVGHVVLEVDVSPVLHAIDRARLRLLAMEGAPPHEYAKAAMVELGHIATAKQAYDDAVWRASERAQRERDRAVEYLTATEPAGRS